jgi:DNA (cytosine-5)-methyltransferase 1
VIGSLFSGYGALETATRNVFGGDVAWVSDIDPGACKILAHHWPDVPNLGDITTVDWSAVEPVDIITGGSPCQDLSHAGKRGGMKTGTRSNLWVAMREAIAQLRPSWVVWENVRGAYSAEADSDVEPCPGCVGDGPSVHLRALGRVLGDLASIGYDAAWHGLTAASVGAPHGRYRVFLLAWPERPTEAAPTHPDRVGHERAGDARGRRGGPADGGSDAAHADSSGLAQREGIPGDARPERAATQRGRGTAANPESNARRVGNRDDGATAHSTRDGRHEGWSEPVGLVRGPDAAECGHAVRWGQFAPAIARWEALTRPAPAPTALSAKGNQRLSPRFVEWLMGLPAGHVTGVPGLTRNEQLKALGNGVVPAQAEAAIRHLLELTHA